MPEQPDNPFAAIDVDPNAPDVAPSPQRSGSRVSIGLMLSGFICVAIGLVLVSNRFGNTDTMGLPVVGLGGLLFGTGLSHLFMKLRYAVVVGLLIAPLSVCLLFVVFWVLVLVTASFNRR